MKRQIKTLLAAAGILVWALPAFAESETNADELRRIENVVVAFQVEGGFPEECVGSVAALRDLVQLIVSTSRIPVLKDTADASHLVTWNFRGQTADSSNDGAEPQCATVGELDVRRHGVSDDGQDAKVVAFESSFQTEDGTKRQVLKAVRSSVSRGTTEFVREVLKARQASE